MKKLPKNIPLFPLPGALLLPNSRLPLNIFEPRYINMVEDALATKHRLIGMIQPKIIKNKRNRFGTYKKSNFKKAFVSLKEGSEIQFEGVN